MQAVDEVLEVPRFQLTKSQRVVGFPAVSSRAVPVLKRAQRFQLEDVTYYLDGRSRLELNTQLESRRHEDASGELLLCPWEISFM